MVAYLVLIISVMLCDCYVKHMVPVSMDISYLYSKHMSVSSFISEHSAISRKLKNKWNGRKWNILIIIFQYHFNITLSNSKHTVNADLIVFAYSIVELWLKFGKSGLLKYGFVLVTWTINLNRFESIFLSN